MTEDEARPAVVAVTWNSAAHLPAFLASIASSTVPVELVVVDNDSADDTLAVVAQLAPEARVVQTGRNAGYSAGINAGLATVDAGRPVLVANPDLRLRSDAVAAFLAAAEPRVGVLAPLVLDEHGQQAPSLRRDPSVARSLADAVLGGTLAGSLGLGELVLDDAAYDNQRAIDWATGAALFVTAAGRAVAPRWDESFFLYSEEVDYCQRIRDAGLEVRFTPTAVVEHDGGELESSGPLWALRAVNRVRLFRRRHGRAVSWAFHAASLLFELRRAATGSRPARRAVTALAHRDLETRAARLTERLGGS